MYRPLQSIPQSTKSCYQQKGYPNQQNHAINKTASVIPCLDKIFSVHGLPHQNISNNAPPPLQDIWTLWGYNLTLRHQKWFQGNAEVERFKQPLGKAIQIANAENEVWQQELYWFLLQYRSTPHSTNQVPPAELLFKGAVCGKLTILHPRKVINKHKQAQTKDKERREYNKQYAERKRHTKPSTINLGSTVLIRQEK